jgi:hypothetical protein
VLVPFSVIRLKPAALNTRPGNRIAAVPGQPHNGQIQAVTREQAVHQAIEASLPDMDDNPNHKETRIRTHS